MRPPRNNLDSCKKIQGNDKLDYGYKIESLGESSSIEKLTSLDARFEMKFRRYSRKLSWSFIQRHRQHTRGS